jgi:hypothetical protein
MDAKIYEYVQVRQCHRAYVTDQTFAVILCGKTPVAICRLYSLQLIKEKYSTQKKAFWLTISRFASDLRTQENYKKLSNIIIDNYRVQNDFRSIGSVFSPIPGRITKLYMHLQIII